MTCLFCRKTMVLEKIDPDGEGNDLIQYRCKLCNHVECVRLYRRARLSQNLSEILWLVQKKRARCGVILAVWTDLMKMNAHASATKER